MDNILLTSIIASASACVGALIPCLFAFLGKRQEYEMERLSKIEDVRRSEFAVYLESLQRMVNDGNRENFLKLQESTNRILLYAGQELSSIVYEYYINLIDRTNSGTQFSLKEHDEYQTKIVNAMRHELGVSKDELICVRVIRA